jgi:hypothetical protein
MHVPVILMVPPTEHVRALSTAAVSGAVRAGSLQLQNLPNFSLDVTFAPVPIGTGGAGDSGAMFQPQLAPRFAVRGFLDVPDLRSLPITIGNRDVFSDPTISSLAVCQDGAAVGDTSTVIAKLRLAELGDLGFKGRDVALAILDTGLNVQFLQNKLGRRPAFDAELSWRPVGPDVHEPGAWPVGHGTMCAYDALIAAPDATLIDAPVLAPRIDTGGSRMDGTLSSALSAMGQLLTTWVAGRLGSFKGLVINNSWGVYHPSWDFPPGHPGRYCDNAQHPFNIQLGAASRAGIDVLFAAGNCGEECPSGRCQGRVKASIMGAGAMADVLTVAGCDTTDQRVGYSSQGPSIDGMYPNKPDLTGYTHFAGSEAIGPNTVDGGTSAACPVVAGCVAALRSAGEALSPRSTVPPSRLFDILRETARPAGGVSREWNADYGYGIINPMAAAAALKLTAAAVA